MAGRRLRAASAFAALLLTTPVSLADSPSARVFELVDQRLEHMRAVALYKAANAKPVEDRPREAIVVAKAREKAAAAGLEPASIEPFFRAQIGAAKAIQYRHLADWALSSEPPAGGTPDLVTEIRPELIRLGDALVQAIRQFLEAGDRFDDRHLEEFKRIVQVEHLREDDETALFDAMRPITLAQ